MNRIRRMTTQDMECRLEAIQALLDGEFSHPSLEAFGPIHTDFREAVRRIMEDDICQPAIITCPRCSESWDRGTPGYDEAQHMTAEDGCPACFNAYVGENQDPRALAELAHSRAVADQYDNISQDTEPRR